MLMIICITVPALVAERADVDMVGAGADKTVEVFAGEQGDVKIVCEVEGASVVGSDDADECISAGRKGEMSCGVGEFKGVAFTDDAVETGKERGVVGSACADGIPNV